MRAEQPLVEEAVGSEARQPVLPEVEGRHRDQRRHEMFKRVEPAVVGNMRADFDEPLIDLRLHADRGFLDHVARPAGDRVFALEPDIERAADVPLRRGGKAREFLDLGYGQVPCGRSRTRRHGHAPAQRPGSHPPGGLHPTICHEKG